MSTPKAIPATHIDLLERPLLAALATTLPNGTPQVTPVWFNYEDGHVHINSAAGRLKDRAIRAKPYLALLVVDPQLDFIHFKQHRRACRSGVQRVPWELSRHRVGGLISKKC